MTITEALRALQPPLVFGDARQIAARRFLEQVEYAKDAARGCRADHEARIAVHRNAHSVEHSILTCSCIAAYADDVRAAAVSMLVAEWRR